MKVALYIGVTALLLGSCSGKQARFACRPSQGLGCVSVSEVYNKVHSGTLELNKTTPRKKESGKRKNETVPAPASAKPRYVVLASAFQGPVYRKPKILRIWLGPWIDEHGVYHAQSYLYKVVEQGHWMDANGIHAIRRNKLRGGKDMLYSDLNPDADLNHTSTQAGR